MSRARGWQPPGDGDRQRRHGVNEDSTFDVAALLAQADQALDHAKERGRNRVDVASLELARRRKQEADAREAPAMAAMTAA